MGRKLLLRARPGLIVLAFALAIRLFFALQMDHLAPRNDERAYMEIANGMLQRGEIESIFRPPGLPAFEAAIVKLGGDLETIRIVQSILSTITLALFGALLWRALGGRVAVFALLLLAVDPVSIGFSHLLWTETLFLFALSVFLALWLDALDGPRRGRMLVAGVALGLCGLVRPVVLTTAPILCAWMLLRDRARWRTTALACLLLAVGACAAVLPWSIRNLRATGSFVLVDTNGAYNFLIGTDPDAMFLDKDDTWSPDWALLDGQPYGTVAAQDPGYAQSRAMEVGLRHIAEDPLRYLRAAWFEGTHLWSLDNFSLRHLRNGWYGRDVAGWILPALTLWSAVFGGVLMLAGFAGWLAAPPSPLRSVSWILLAHSAFLHAALFSLSRFQMPLRAFLALGAAYFVCNPRPCIGALWRGGRPTRRGWILLAILVVLVAAWWRDAALFRDMLFDGGAAHRFQRREVGG